MLNEKLRVVRCVAGKGGYCEKLRDDSGSLRMRRLHVCMMLPQVLCSTPKSVSCCLSICEKGPRRLKMRCHARGPVGGIVCCEPRAFIGCLNRDCGRM